jgi:hypothetical protein
LNTIKQKWLVYSAVIVVGLGIALAGIQTQILREEQLARDAALKEFTSKKYEVEAVLFTAMFTCNNNWNQSYEWDEFEPETLIINGMGQYESTGASYEEIVCVLENLEAPSSVLARLGNTRALDGVQEASWDSGSGDWSIEAFWSYHPDDGADVILELKSRYLEDFEAGIGLESP